MINIESAEQKCRAIILIISRDRAINRVLVSVMSSECNEADDLRGGGGLEEASGTGGATLR